MSGRGPRRPGSPFAGRRGRLVAAGVIVGGVLGAVLLGLLALGVAGLLAATWPALRPSERLVRVLVLAVLVAIAVGLVVR